jgi:hypothetical protein
MFIYFILRTSLRFEINWLGKQIISIDNLSKEDGWVIQKMEIELLGFW